MDSLWVSVVLCVYSNHIWKEKNKVEVDIVTKPNAEIPVAVTTVGWLLLSSCVMS